MKETKQSNEANDEPASVTDPVAAADSGGLAIDQRTHVHENREQYRDHCESDAVGRAIVGVTDPNDRLLPARTRRCRRSTTSFSVARPRERRSTGCADNPFELGWYDELPVAEEESEHIADVRLFVG